jgi:outer membrane protein assembly factor BamB
VTLPDLKLVWRTTVDSATCFEIFKFNDNFIVHGELEISKIDQEGNIIWRFSGSDIFTTPTGKDSFKIVNEIIYATNWDNVTFELNANTGQLINIETIKSIYS